MSDISLLLLGAGSSSRFGMKVKKQWLWIEDRPLWLYVLEQFEKIAEFQEIYITASKDEKAFFQKYSDATIIEGGATRQASIENVLHKVSSRYILISDIARCCINKEVVQNILANKDKADCIAPFITPSDTTLYEGRLIDRDKVKLIQTPQLSKVAALKEALKLGDFTDESTAMKSAGKSVLYLIGDRAQHKLTFKEDLNLLPCLKAPKPLQQSGIGFDVHPFCEGRDLKLCGVKIDYPLGLQGHSDADVAIHALIDALLAAVGFGDIGELFPDSDSAYRDIDSTLLLKRTKELLEKCGFEIDFVDLTIIAQKPKIAPYKEIMQQNIASLLDLEKRKVNIKATTTEKLGFIGRSEGIAAQALATVKIFDWSRI